MTREDEIKAIEEELAKTKYNKATQGHIGKLKAKVARLREEADKASSGKSYGPGFGVKKSGDATVLLVGFPSVGKSTLVNSITNAQSKTGAYDFTTLNVVPGMLEYSGAKIQVLDIPGMISDASKGAGKGRQVLSAVRNADLIIFVLDKMEQLPLLERELYNAGFRLDQKPPDVRITRKETGGVNVNIAVKRPRLGKESIRGILSEFKIHNADVIVRQDINEDQLIDAVLKNRLYIPSIKVLNKIDRMDKDALAAVPKGYVKISAGQGRNLGELREAVWRKLGFLRVYLKPVGKEPDMEEPLIMKGGATVMDVGKRILRGQEKYFKYARIWGPSAKFPEQKVGAEHKLRDGDVVELHA